MKCKIQKYDPAVTEAPFQMIDVETIEVNEPEFYSFAAACRERGYQFKFFTLGDNECDFIIVVYGEFEANQMREISQSLMSNFSETYSKLSN